MTKIQILLSLVLTASLFFSCGSGTSNIKTSRTHISGTMENGAGEMMLVNKIVPQKRQLVAQVIDTIFIGEDNTYDHTFKKALEKDFYVLTAGQRSSVYLITDSTENIVFNSDLQNLNDYTLIQGSPDTESFKELSELMKSNREPLAELMKEESNAKTLEEKKEFYQRKKALRESNIKTVEEFIDGHTNNAGIAAFFEGMDFSLHPKLAQKTINHLAKLVPNSHYYGALAAQVEGISKQGKDVGKTAPNIELNDPAGKKRTLYELRGKTVLIDFWASWCGPCRRENPNVVKAYNKYHDAGFEVMSVSLDKDKDKWVKAIEEDGLIWDYHVSDLKHWDTPYKTLYNFSGIPHAVLVNKEGVIIQSKIRGSQLDEQLEIT